MRYAVLLAVLIMIGCSGSSGSHSGGGIVQASSGFSNANLSGNYAFTGNGTFSGQTPESSLGIISVDGNGIVTGGESLTNIGGITCHLTAMSGSYNVTSNGTGRVTLNGTLDQQSIDNGCSVIPSTLALVIANGGNSVLVIDTNPLSVISYVGVKQ